MAPPTTSPTSLLWAYQLKREHGYLLQRMNDLETENEDHDSRIKTAESAGLESSSKEVKKLAQQVKTLQENDVQKRLSDMGTGIAEKMDDLQAESETHTLVIASLQDQQKAAQGEYKKDAAAREQTMLKRITEMESGLKKYETSLDRMGKRLDQTRFDQIKAQLEDLMKQAKIDSEDIEKMARSIAALEAGNAELTKANAELERKLAKMAAKAASAAKDPAAGATTRINEPDTTAGAEEQNPPKKKSHKWAGGGADRDIIRLGSDLFNSPRAAAKSPITAAKEPSKKKPAPPKATKTKRQIPAKKIPVQSDQTLETPKKSHRWAGGGADRDIIQAGTTFNAGTKRRRSSSATVEPPAQKKGLLSGDGVEHLRVAAGSPSVRESASLLLPPSKSDSKLNIASAARSTDGFDGKVIKAGKGWVEVAEPDVEVLSQASNGQPPEKRKRGRPRKAPKAHVTPHWDVLSANSQGRTLRHSVAQSRESADVLADSANTTAPNRAPATATTRKIEQEAFPDLDAMSNTATPVGGIVVSTQGTNDNIGRKEPIARSLFIPDSQPDEIAVKPRRQILQDDDDPLM